MNIALRRSLRLALGLAGAVLAGGAELLALSRARWRLARYH